MKARTRSIPCAVVLVALATNGSAAAQGRDDHGGAFVGVKGGLNYEQAEDGLAGTAGAGGVFAGVRLGRDWSGEIDLWIPGSLHDATGGRHRDILLSVSAVRWFGANRPRTYLLAGFSVASTENEFTTCFADDRSVPPGHPGEGRTIVDCSRPDVTERRREQFGGTGTYLTGGAGVEVPVGRRLQLVPEFRLHVAIGSIIVRPAVGFRFDF